MKRLTNFVEQNDIKIKQLRAAKCKSIQPEFSAYLKKLDDTISKTKHEDILWQPNIKRSNNYHQSESDSFSSWPLSSESCELQSNMANSLPECGKAHCKLGCICDNLTEEPNASLANNSLIFISSSEDSASPSFISSKSKAERDHCGRVECMFDCNCSRKLRKSTLENGASKKCQQKSNSNIESSRTSRRTSCRLKSGVAKKSKKESVPKKQQQITKTKLVVSKKEKTKNAAPNADRQRRSSSSSISDLNFLIFCYHLKYDRNLSIII
jgi:hypothetical protein